MNPSEPKEGDRVTLTCSADSNPGVSRYEWYKNGERLTVENTATLQFTHVFISDTGGYKCLPVNSVGRGQYSPEVKLDVLYPPKPVTAVLSEEGEIVEGGKITLTCASDVSDAPRNTKVTLSNSTVHEGGALTLTCETESNPPAQITWYKDGIQYSRSSERTLQFANVTRQDGGNYSCVATNTLGNHTSESVSVTVTYTSSVSSTSAPLGIVLGISVILLLILIVYIVKRSYRRKPKETSAELQGNPDSSGPTYATVNKAHKKKAVQENVEMSDGIYCDVEYTNKESQNYASIDFKQNTGEESNKKSGSKTKPAYTIGDNSPAIYSQVKAPVQKPKKLKGNPEELHYSSFQNLTPPKGKKPKKHDSSQDTQYAELNY
nr:PREDICTED: cell adhesion molecule 2 [Latimeria chalumnae]|eukprot:XP_014353301.1 PREDICTED: cell adhesion molecule 2 [Latimeria chalumnae]